MILRFKDDFDGMAVTDFIEGSLNHTFVLKTRNLTYYSKVGLVVDTTVLRANDSSVSYVQTSVRAELENAGYAVDIRFLYCKINNQKH